MEVHGESPSESWMALTISIASCANGPHKGRRRNSFASFLRIQWLIEGRETHLREHTLPPCKNFYTDRRETCSGFHCYPRRRCKQICPSMARRCSVLERFPIPCPRNHKASVLSGSPQDNISDVRRPALSRLNFHHRSSLLSCCCTGTDTGRRTL